MPDLHDFSGIGDFQAHFGCADIGIENREDVIDPPFKNPVRICIQVDVREFTEMHRAKSFSYTSHMIHTYDKSEMVKG